MSEKPNWMDPEYFLQQLNPDLFIEYMNGASREFRRIVNLARDCAENMVRYADPDETQCLAIAQGMYMAILLKGKNSIVTFTDLELDAVDFQGSMNSSSFYGNPKRAQQVAEVTVTLIEGIQSGRFEIARLE